MKNDKAFQWKALRLMQKKDVSLLSKVSEQSGNLEAVVGHFFDQMQDKEGQAEADPASTATS